MTGMQFAIELLDKLLWPIVVLICVFTFKKSLTRLIPQAKKVKFPGGEIDFGKDLKNVAKEAKGAFPELEADEKSGLIAVANNLPNSAILDSWKVVDRAAESLVRSFGTDVDLDTDTRYKTIEDILIGGTMIDSKKGKIFSELRRLRNKVAHAEGFRVSRSEAFQYIELCFRLKEYLEQVERSQK